MASNIAPPVGLFGKVPSHPDFVRLNAGGPLARSLDNWLQEGLSQMRVQLGDNWEAAFDAAQPMFFLYRDKDPGETLIGVCRPGRDQSGRRYPFSVFAQIRLARDGSGLHLLPYACGRFLQAARRLATVDCRDGIDNQRAASIMSLSSTLPQNLVEIQTRFEQYLNDVTMESFWRGLYPDFNDPRKYLVIKNLFAALVPRRGHDPMRFGFTLHFPTASEWDFAVAQLAIWVLVCRAVLGTKALEQAVLFWYTDTQAPSRGCYLSFRPPLPNAMAALLAPVHTLDSIWSLESMGADKAASARDALGSELAGALDSSTHRMKDFLKALQS